MWGADEQQKCCRIGGSGHVSGCRIWLLSGRFEAFSGRQRVAAWVVWTCQAPYISASLSLHGEQLHGRGDRNIFDGDVRGIFLTQFPASRKGFIAVEVGGIARIEGPAFPLHVVPRGDLRGEQ